MPMSKTMTVPKQPSMFALFTDTSFLKSFLFFVIFFSIVSYFLTQVGNRNKNEIIKSENNTLIFIFVILMGFMLRNIIQKNSASPTSLKFVVILIFLFLIQYIINFVIEYHIEREQDKSIFISGQEITRFFILLTTTIILSFIVLLILPGFLPDIENVKEGFIKSVNSDKWTIFFITLFYFSFRYTFGVYNTRNAKTSIFLPTVLGINVILSIFAFVYYIGVTFQLFNWKQTITTFIVFCILGSLFFYLWLYLFITSLSNMCKKKPTKEELKIKNSFFGKYMFYLLLIGIFILLWLLDTPKWNRIECILYLVITIILFTSYTKLSTSNPSTSLITLWLSFEWLFVTFYNWLNVSNSFHCIFSA